MAGGPERSEVQRPEPGRANQSRAEPRNSNGVCLLLIPSVPGTSGQPLFGPVTIWAVPERSEVQWQVCFLFSIIFAILPAGNFFCVPWDFLAGGRDSETINLIVPFWTKCIILPGKSLCCPGTSLRLP